MKKYILPFFLIFCCLLPFTLGAQDRIVSLELKERELEESIRKALKPFVQAEDYIVKVRLIGERTMEPATKILKFSQQNGESLPGFELEEKTLSPKIADIMGSSYWKINKMRVDLIMHKEISKSIEEFIRTTIPILIEKNDDRADVFNFKTILPTNLEQDKQDEMKEAGIIPVKKYYGFTQQEWIYIAILAVLVLIILILLWKVQNIRQGMSALEDMIEQDHLPGRDNDVHQSVEDLNNEIREKIKRQEDKVNETFQQEENNKLSLEIIAQLVGRKDWRQQLLEELQQEKEGVDQLARFFYVLGPVTSRNLFAKVMGDERYLELESIAESVERDAYQDQALLKNIRTMLFNKQLTSPEEIKSDPFKFLEDLSNTQIGFLIKKEPVKIKAIVLSRLKGVDVAVILKKVPKVERAQVILLLGNLSELPVEVLEKVAYDIAKKAHHVPDENVAAFDGVEMILDVISESDEFVRKELINKLRVSDRKLSEQVESRFFLFDSIPVLPKVILMEVIRALPAETSITAINGCQKKLQEKVILCFPEKIRRTLVASLKAQKPTPDEIKSCQKQIIQGIQKMAANKKVSLRQVLSDWEKLSTKMQAV